jgi:ParB family chromosome partitioning protein
VTKEKRLGRGLEALLGQLPGWNGAAPPGQVGAPAASDPSGPATIPIRPIDGAPAEKPAAKRTSVDHPAGHESNAGPLRLEIDSLKHNPHQPRQEFDAEELQRLADSIRTYGLLQPVVVRPWQGGYQLIAGERRLRAARLAGWTEVPVTVVEADEQQTAELAIVENLQRKDLSALEKAASFQRYLDQYGGTQEELASRLKLDRSTISNLIRLLELPEAVQDALRRGKITPGHARALLPLGDEREQLDFCDRIQKEGLNVRQTELIVQETIAATDDSGGQPRRPSGKPRRASDHLSALEQEFRNALGVRVKITHDARGRGKLVIAFASHEEFDLVRRHICGGSQAARRAQAG